MTKTTNKTSKFKHNPKKTTTTTTTTRDKARLSAAAASAKTPLPTPTTTTTTTIPPGKDSDADKDVPIKTYLTEKAKWKLLFLTGVLFLVLAVAAIGAHVRTVKVSQAAQYDDTTTRSFDDNDDKHDNDNDDFYHDTDLFVDACGPRLWPALLGMNVNDARTVILESNPCVFVQIVLASARVGRDYDPERVRLFMNPSTGTVVLTPRIG